VTPLECAREVDVIDAIMSRRWPARVDAELRSHVQQCAICADVAEVAAALQDGHSAALLEARDLPSADVVWFKSQARAKAEAARQATRPVAIMQAIGLAAATGVISLLIGVVAFWVWQRAEWMTLMPSLPTLEPLHFASMGFAVRGVLLAIGLWLILAPVAVYLVASDD
jgi:hypothetical protein